VTVDTSPITIEWAVGQDDADGRQFTVRFGARILTERQQAYLQVKRELLGTFKAEKNYLIGVNVMLETDCLPLFGMIANCSIPNIAMLGWIAYIKSMNLVLVHITDKNNFVADMLSRVRYVCEEKMEIQEVDEDNEDDDYGYILTTSGTNLYSENLPLRANQYKGRLRHIGIYLNTLKTQE
jgi:hypothetical protein